MLQGVFGSKSVARILLFLFVNERCYATQIHSLLEGALTPIQKALLRLEKEGILVSHYEGKQRIYEFNSNYPLRQELELLLKKSYTLLSSQEKKCYCFIHRSKKVFKEEMEDKQMKKAALLAFWEKLLTVKELSFSAKSKRGESLSTKFGKASVEVISSSSSTLIFQEKGVWFDEKRPDSVFNSSFRWTLDLKSLLITLEHLRYGSAHPVFLFHLTPSQPFALESVDAHLCSADTYLGNIVWDRSHIDFYWRIIGPLKNDQLTYHYE